MWITRAYTHTLLARDLSDGGRARAAWASPASGRVSARRAENPGRARDEQQQPAATRPTGVCVCVCVTLLASLRKQPGGQRRRRRRAMGRANRERESEYGNTCALATLASARAHLCSLSIGGGQRVAEERNCNFALGAKCARPFSRLRSPRCARVSPPRRPISAHTEARWPLGARAGAQRSIRRRSLCPLVLLHVNFPRFVRYLNTVACVCECERKWAAECGAEIVDRAWHKSQ